MIDQEVKDRSILVNGQHIFDVLIDAIEIRLDYMGSTTLMGRMCHIVLHLKDDRHPHLTMRSPADEIPPPLTLVVFNSKWSQLHLMITRSTTPDLIRMAMKLSEFFKSQLSSSKKVLDSIQNDLHHKTQTSSNPSKTVPSSIESIKNKTDQVKRHIGMNGGEIVFQGHNLTLVVFHGLNFKSRQWAVFSLNEPQINFVTERGQTGESK